MPQGTVQAIGKSRSGKPTVTVDGQVYSASQVDLSGMQVGDKIEMDTASSVYNGATVWFLNGYKLVQGAQKYPPSQATPSGISTPIAPQAAPGISEGERLTVSNWVAAAIAAGLVKDHADLGIWAHTALEAIRSAGKPVPF